VTSNALVESTHREYAVCCGKMLLSVQTLFFE
jgi:hypothetical protein